MERFAMRFTSKGGFLQFDKWYDYVYPVGFGGEIGGELDSTFWQVGIKGERCWDGRKFGSGYRAANLKVDGNHAVWIWAHGNRHRDFIAAGANEISTPGNLVRKLKNLDKGSSGHIVVWSCFAGALDGFVEHFAAAMQRAGYNNLRFWGHVGITSVLQRSDSGNQWADAYAQVLQTRSSGTLISSGSSKSRATRSDMNGFGPGLRTAYTRSFEAP